MIYKTKSNFKNRYSHKPCPRLIYPKFKNRYSHKPCPRLIYPKSHYRISYVNKKSNNHYNFLISFKMKYPILFQGFKIFSYIFI